MADTGNEKDGLVDLSALTKLSHSLFSADAPGPTTPLVSFGHEARDHMMRHRFGGAPAEAAPEPLGVDLSALNLTEPPPSLATPAGLARTFPKFHND